MVEYSGRLSFRLLRILMKSCQNTSLSAVTAKRKERLFENPLDKCVVFP